MASRDQGVVPIFMIVKGVGMFFLPRLILLLPAQATRDPVLFNHLPGAKHPFGTTQPPKGGVSRREDKVFKFFSCQDSGMGNFGG